MEGINALASAKYKVADVVISEQLPWDRKSSFYVSGS